MKKHVLFEFLTLKWLNYMHFLFWPSESPSYNYAHLKFLIFIESTYFSHMMIIRGGAVQFFKTVVTLVYIDEKYVFELCGRQLFREDLTQLAFKWAHLRLASHAGRQSCCCCCYSSKVGMNRTCAFGSFITLARGSN